MRAAFIAVTRFNVGNAFRLDRIHIILLICGLERKALLNIIMKIVQSGVLYVRARV